MELSEKQIIEIIQKLRKINYDDFKGNLTSEDTVDSLFEELNFLERKSIKYKSEINNLIDGLTDKISSQYFDRFKISNERNEFDVIKSALNTYIEEIQGIIVSKKELEKSNLELEKVISENKKLNKIKDEFISNISHEFRTPLNGILNFSHIIKDKLGDSITESNIELNYIIYSSNVLLSIVDNILNNKDLEGYKINSNYINPSLLIKIIVDTFSTLAHSKSITINLVIELESSYRIKTDQKLFINICNNLLSNAIKFSIEKKPIDVILKNENDKLIIIFTDNGPGIEESKIELLTQPSIQGNHEYKRTYGGIGLGLDIVKQSLNLINGNIEIESKKDFGSNVKIVLPNINNQENLELIPSKKIKILIVEDNIMNQVLIKTILQNENHKVVIANDGVDGYEKYTSEDFDIILMDLMMPRMNGYETTQKIRFMSDPVKSNIPIIAVTADVSPKIKEKCIAFGMNDYISKPYSKEELFDIIRKYT